jgi:hypothetical protein
MRRLVGLLVLVSLVAGPSWAGFFRVKQDKGVWWLIDGDGKKFFSTGINVISAGGDPKTVNPDNPEYFGLKFYKNHDAWWKATSGRMRKWGFNTAGGWSDERVLAKRDMPYVVSLHLGSYVGAPWVDVGSQASMDIIRPLVEPLAKYRDDPLLIGYFIDNELGWYEDSVFSYWAALDAADPSKARLWDMLNEAYRGDLKAFSADFKVMPKPASFKALKKKMASIEIMPGRRPQVVYTFLEWLAGEYYRILTGEVRKVDPNHMILGDRYASYYSQAVVRAAGKYLDIVSVNFNTYAQSGWMSPAFFDTIYRLTGKPIMVTEFYAAAMENRSGNRNQSGPFLVVQTQKQRAEGAGGMAEQMARLPYCVGYHWFQWSDEPPKGRGDGEDFNMGLVDLNDRPYEELTAAFTRVNKNIPRLRREGPVRAGLESVDGAWVVPASSSSITVDGQMDEWSCRDSWVPGVAAKSPWLPFADFYLSWEPEGLVLGAVYHEYFAGGGDGSTLRDRQRLVLTVSGGKGEALQVALVGIGEREGPPPQDPKKDTRGPKKIVTYTGPEYPVPALLAGVHGAQWERSLNRTLEIFIPASAFGRQKLARGDQLSLGASLVMRGDTKEAFWPATQVNTKPSTGRLATVRLGGKPGK